MPTTANRMAAPAPSADGSSVRRTLRILAADADPAAREFYQKAMIDLDKAATARALDRSVDLRECFEDFLGFSRRKADAGVGDDDLDVVAVARRGQRDRQAARRIFRSVVE